LDIDFRFWTVVLDNWKNSNFRHRDRPALPAASRASPRCLPISGVAFRSWTASLSGADFFTRLDEFIDVRRLSHHGFSRPCLSLNKKNARESEPSRTRFTRKLPNMDIGIRSRADGGETQRYNPTIELPRDLQRSNLGSVDRPGRRTTLISRHKRLRVGVNCAELIGECLWGRRYDCRANERTAAWCVG
jgi:hypothetical protein